MMQNMRLPINIRTTPKLRRLRMSRRRTSESLGLRDPRREISSAMEASSVAEASEAMGPRSSRQGSPQGAHPAGTAKSHGNSQKVMEHSKIKEKSRNHGKSDKAMGTPDKHLALQKSLATQKSHGKSENRGQSEVMGICKVTSRVTGTPGIHGTSDAHHWKSEQVSRIPKSIEDPNINGISEKRIQKEP